MKLKLFRPLFLAAFFAVSISLRAAIPPAENLLPADTLFLVTTPDCAAFRAALHQSPQWLLWNDPAMKSFHDKFISNCKAQFVAPLERDLGVKLADFANLPQGQFTFAITQNGWNGGGGQAPGFLLLLDAKNKSGLLKTNLAALQKKWKDAGKPIHTEMIRGVSFSVVPLSSNAIPASVMKFFPKRQPVQELGKKPAPEKTSELVVGQFESLLIAGNSVKAVEPIVAHLTGSGIPALSANPFFAADKVAELRNAPLYYGWFNAKTFFSVIAQIPTAQPNPEAPTPFPRIPWPAILRASGLMGLTSAAFNYRESHDGSQMNFFLSMPEASRAGIFKMFATERKDSSPPPFVPADATKFSRWRVDGKTAWASLQTIVADISPTALRSLNSVIDIANMTAQRNDPGFDVRKNLIGNLGDDFISYQKVPAGTTLTDLKNAPSLFLFAAANPDEAALAIKNVGALVSGGQPAAATRDFLGKKIYTIPLPNRSAQFAAVPAPAASLYCAASGGYVAVTKNISILENYLRSAGNPARPLREIPGFMNAAQHVGGVGSGLFGYENQRDVMRTAFTAFKLSGGAEGQNLLAALPAVFRNCMDFSLLPDFDKVSKYFYFSVYAGDATANGVSLKAFAPRPPQLN
ncbi:MAG: hypothetical protein ACREFE_03730 [Limisphaerales bacterium]